MILSNNHVLANVNAGPINESILQPGPFDGGRHPADQVAVLERFVNINFGGGRVGRFVDQIAIRSPSGDFSQGGDSGSLIWTRDARRAPVGLLFAGGGGTTFANRITRVLNALDVNVF